MSFLDSIKSFWTNYAVFKGRASRNEYWWAVLHVVLITLVLSFLDVAVNSSQTFGQGLLVSIFSLASFLPSLAMTSRRFHDYGLPTALAVSLYLSVLTPSFIAGFVVGYNETVSSYDAIDYEGAATLVGLFSLLAIGALIAIIVITLMPSKPDNQYGENNSGPIVYYNTSYSTPQSVAPYAPVTPQRETTKPIDKSNSPDSKIERITSLHKMYKDGILTLEEFEELKKKEIGS